MINLLKIKEYLDSYEINKMIEIDKSGKEDFGYNILSLLSIQSWLNPI